MVEKMKTEYRDGYEYKDKYTLKDFIVGDEIKITVGMVCAYDAEVISINSTTLSIKSAQYGYEQISLCEVIGKKIHE